MTSRTSVAYLWHRLRTVSLCLWLMMDSITLAALKDYGSDSDDSNDHHTSIEDFSLHLKTSVDKSIKTAIKGAISVVATPEVAVKVSDNVG